MGTLNQIADMYKSIDTVHDLIQKMILNLIKLHSSNTEEGSFLREGINDLKNNLERDFSEKYKEPYIDMVTSITFVAKLLREDAKNIPQKK